MNQLTDEMLIAAYKRAIELSKIQRLPEGFIDLLEKEIHKRNLLLKKDKQD